MSKYRWIYNTGFSVIFNLFLTLMSFMLCRVVFILVNYSYFSDLTFNRLLKMFEGGLIFDTSAILYTNILYLALMLFPIHYKETALYQKITKIIFLFTNIVVLVVNLMDTVFFQYTKRRTTASIFSEFKNEDNLFGIIGIEIIHNWYLVVFAVLMSYLLYRFYRIPKTNIQIPNLFYYYIVQVVILCIAGYLIVGGMRGGIGKGMRPITISNANKYVSAPIETSIVLNTPFSIYRTLGKKVFSIPNYWADRELMQQYYSPLHQPEDSVEFKPSNVVILILESFGKENSGFLNPHLDNGTYKGYMPFLDSLMQEGLTFQYSYANGMKSIDAMPSVLSSIPMFMEPFILTPASLNELSGVAGELKKKGYYTSFFHGARSGSMGFDSYAYTSGFTDYFGQDEYNNSEDHDGHWGVWDEPFLQYFAGKLSTFKEPFLSSIFTLSSHHPFRVPEQYEGKFPKGNIPIHQCIGYTDNALKLFFDRIKHEEWFQNTLFVITADHTNAKDHKEYQTAQGVFSVPIIFYHPDGTLKKLDQERIASQIDIMPTVLGYVGYNNPYIAFGTDLINTEPEETFAVNYLNGVYQFFKGDFLLQFDGEKPLALYRFKTDIMLENNLLDSIDEKTLTPILLELKSIIQQYMERMTNNELVVKND